MGPRVQLLGVPIDPVTSLEAIECVKKLLVAGQPAHVMTPNNEMLVEATSNPRFHQVLRESALNIPDSQGLLLMARWTGQHLPERVTGVDTVERLCAGLDSEHPVFLLGGTPGVAEKAAEVFRAKNSQLKISGTFSGSPRAEEAADIISRINASQAHLLLVAFGSPAQDLWIAQHLHEMPSVRVAMVVGGTFDFVAGIRSRAPRLFRLLGLEWLWRFAHEPSRWRRMWTAVIIFPFLVIRHGKHS